MFTECVRLRSLCSVPRTSKQAPLHALPAACFQGLVLSGGSATPLGQAACGSRWPGRAGHTAVRPEPLGAVRGPARLRLFLFGIHSQSNRCTERPGSRWGGFGPAERSGLRHPPRLPAPTPHPRGPSCSGIKNAREVSAAPEKRPRAPPWPREHGCSPEHSCWLGPRHSEDKAVTDR